MKGYIDNCIDADVCADLREPGAVYIDLKKPLAGKDNLRKVRKFYAAMNQRASEIRRRQFPIIAAGRQIGQAATLSEVLTIALDAGLSLLEEPLLEPFGEIGLCWLLSIDRE